MISGDALPCGQQPLPSERSHGAGMGSNVSAVSGDRRAFAATGQMFGLLTIRRPAPKVRSQWALTAMFAPEVVNFVEFCDLQQVFQKRYSEYTLRDFIRDDAMLEKSLRLGKTKISF